MKILCMPLQELKNLIIQNIYENPLLEIDSEDYDAKSENDFPSEEGPEATVDDIDYSISENPVTAGVWSDTTDRFAQISTKQTFVSMLEEQIGVLKLETGMAELCKYMICCLDKRGYLDSDPAEIAQELGCPLQAVLRALTIIQGLQPAGVGARSLKECLLLQLKSNPKQYNMYTVKLVNEGLKLLADNNLTAIAGLLKMNKEDAQHICKIVRNLSPIPSRGYNTGEQNLSVIPDAVVKKEGAGFSVTINRNSYSKLEFCREYINMLTDARETDVKKYLRENYNNAKGLIKSVKYREHTLTRVIRQIVSLQSDFLGGKGILRPMGMAEIADSLGLHISTVSRAIQGKYIFCLGKTIELKSLFSAGVTNNYGELVAVDFIRQELKKQIDEEDKKHPLSDESLRLALKASNIDVARRTIAKYREELGILSSARRKRI